MHDNTKLKLKTFAENNNWSLTHPLDTERFHKFIIEAYNNGDIEISRNDFLEVVNPIYKMSEDEIDKWIIKFENGISLLKAYNKI